jgi:signal transduction histidine kinase
MATYAPRRGSDALVSPRVFSATGRGPLAVVSADERVDEPGADIQRAIQVRVIAAQEAERARIARELHDVVGQALTAVRLNLMRLHLANARMSASSTEITESLAAVDAALVEVRTAAFDLRPSVLDDLGLGAGLRALCRRVSLRAGLAISCRVEVRGDRLPAEVETACYRIAQEAITNVVRHANARTASVSLRLRRRSGVLELIVADDGVGFDPSRRNADGHLGIAVMAERAALAWGDLEVRAAVREGTRVTARFRVDMPRAVRA